MGALNQQTSRAELEAQLARMRRELDQRQLELETARLDRERYRRLVEHAADGLVVHDRNGRFLEVNRRAADILGYSVEELLCMGLADVEPDFDAFGMRGRFDEMRHGEVLTVEGRPRRRDGVPVVVEVRVSLLEDGASGRQYIAFLRDITDRKKTVRALSESSERFRRMLEEYQGHLVQVERLAMFGTLGAAVGHELNNLGQVFMGAADLLSMESTRTERLQHVALELQRATEQLSHHAKHLLAAGRPSSTADEELDLGAQIVDTVSLLRRAGKLKRTRLELQLPPQPLYVLMNRSRLEQVLINLLTNAAEALADGAGSVVVGVEQRGARAIVRVVDEGVGIAQEDLARVFDPYFTTKTNHVGLGLLVVRQISRDYGGDATIRSVPRQGTEVRCEFPTCAEPTLGPIPAGWELPRPPQQPAGSSR